MLSAGAALSASKAGPAHESATSAAPPSHQTTAAPTPAAAAAHPTATSTASAVPLGGEVITVKRHVKRKKKKKAKKNESAPMSIDDAQSAGDSDAAASGGGGPASFGAENGAISSGSSLVAKAPNANSATSTPELSRRQRPPASPSPGRSSQGSGSPRLHTRSRSSTMGSNGGHSSRHSSPSAHVVYRVSDDDVAAAAALDASTNSRRSWFGTSASRARSVSPQPPASSAKASMAEQAAVARQQREAEAAKMAAAAAAARAEAEAQAAREAEKARQREVEAEAKAAEMERLRLEALAQAEAHAEAERTAAAEAQRKAAAAEQAKAEAHAHAEAAAESLRQARRCATDLLHEDHEELFLLIRLQFLKSETEDILKVTMTSTFDGFHESPQLVVLATRGIYLLRQGTEADGPYELDKALPFHVLQHITELHSAQGLALHYKARGDHPHAAPIITGCRAVTAGLEEAFVAAWQDALRRQLAAGSETSPAREAALPLATVEPGVLRTDSARLAAAAALFDELDATDRMRTYHLGYVEATASAADAQRRSEVAREGRLSVQRENLMSTTWKPYYFILRWPHLVMMQSEKDAVAKGRVNLTATDLVCQAVPREDPRVNDQPYAFCCGPRAEPWLLAATSAAERAAWLRVLNGPLPPLLGDGGPAPPAVPTGSCWFNMSMLISDSQLYLCREDHELNKMT